VSGRRARTGRYAAAAGGLAAAFACAAAHAGTPPLPKEPPECWVRITVAQPAQPVLDVDGWMQYGHTDSVELMLAAPALARWNRLEARVASEALVLQPRAATGRYRVEVPRGALLQWAYPAAFAAAESLPQSFGPDHACAYLGGFVLAPRRFDQPAVPAAERWFVQAALPSHWRAVAPWNTRDGLLRPRDAADLLENFAGWGRWKIRTTVTASACTLQVAAAGGVADSLGAGPEAQIAQHFGPGRALVLLVPAAGVPRAFLGARSALLKLPAAPATPAGFDAAWAARRRVQTPAAPAASP